MPDYKLTELLMHYLTTALNSHAADPSVGDELNTLRQSLMRLESTVERFNEALKKDVVPTVQISPAPVRYEYKSLWGTHQIGDYAAIGYRLHSITPDGTGDGSMLIVMEREVPAEELEDDIFEPTTNYSSNGNGKAE